MNDSNNKLIFGKLLFGIVMIVLLIAGGTYALWGWESSQTQLTNVVTVIPDVCRVSVDGGVTVDSSSINMVPASCTNTKNAIVKEINTTIEFADSETPTNLELWLNVDNIASELANTPNFKYAVTESPTSCVDNVISSGTFEGYTSGDQIEFLSESYTGSLGVGITKTYYLYIWLDAAETDVTTAGKSFKFSLGGTCSNEIYEDMMDVAVYSADDNSLRFYKTASTITEGSTYNGLTATAVYTGFEDSTYTSYSSVPWYSNQNNITNVVVEDEISPVSTAYWFYQFRYVTSMDLEKLNTSNVTNMDSMFYETGYITSTFELIGLDSWNVSNVTNMNSMFYRVGYGTSTLSIGNISNWSTSNVTNMAYMFYQAGYSATYTLDLSGWNVSSVTNYLNFNYGVESKITLPTAWNS